MNLVLITFTLFELGLCKSFVFFRIDSLNQQDRMVSVKFTQCLLETVVVVVKFISYESTPPP